MGRTLTDAETLRDGGLESRHVGGDLRHLERLRQHHTEREAVVVRGAEGVQCRDALRSEPEADTAFEIAAFSSWPWIRPMRFSTCGGASLRAICPAITGKAAMISWSSSASPRRTRAVSCAYSVWALSMCTWESASWPTPYKEDAVTSWARICSAARAASTSDAGW